MQIYWNKRKHLHKKRVQLPQDWFGTPTWPPWRHVETLYCFRRSRCRRLRRCVSSLLFWKPASHPSTPPPPKLISGSGWTGPQLAWWIPNYKLSLEKKTSPTNRHVFDTTLSFKCKSTIRVILVIFRFWRNINLHNFFFKRRQFNISLPLIKRFSSEWRTTQGTCRKRAWRKWKLKIIIINQD